MPLIDMPLVAIDAPVDTPKGFAVTPGQADLDHGSDVPDERKTWSATFGQAFRQDNIIGDVLSSESFDRRTPEAGFNPWDKIKGTKYESHWDSFVDVNNTPALEAMKRKIDQEEDDRKALNAVPWYQSVPAQMAAGVFDLPTLLPGGAFVRSVKGGFSMGRSALSVGAAAGVASTAQEGALQALQETRPLLESGVNIGASMFLGGLLGAGGAKLLSRVEWNRAVQAIESELTGGPVSAGGPETIVSAAVRLDGKIYEGIHHAEAAQRAARDTGLVVDDLFNRNFDSDGFVTSRGRYVGREEASRIAAESDQIAPIGDRTRAESRDLVLRTKELLAEQLEPPPLGRAGGGAPASVGAAANEPFAIEGNTIAGRAAGAVAASTARLNPALRILQSPSPATREIGTQLFENSVYLKKNIEGVASQPAVETLMKEWNAGLAKALQATNEAYGPYRKAGGQLARDEFREAVGRAMRRGDESDIPEVAKIAKEWRKEVFDPLKEAAIKAKLLPEDVSVETAASYFSRMWNRNKLIAREGEFKGIVQDWVARMMPKWAEQYDKGVERRLNPIRREIADLEMAKLRRAEELKQREEGGEIEAGEFSESDIRSALRIVEGGAPKPKGVLTLTQFVRKEGGLVDDAGELRQMGINNKSMPGFVRNEKWRYLPSGAGKTDGGWDMERMSQHAWEHGYFPDHVESAPSKNEFLELLSDDFNKRRAIVPYGSGDAYRLNELIHQLDQDLARVGVTEAKGARFSTSEEAKGMVSRVFKAMDAEADRKIAALKSKLLERETEARVDREARFIGDAREMGRSIADDVFNTLTGKTEETARPEFITVKARGPLKERTFHIPDDLVEDFLESDVELVGRRYVRIMGADVELANKFGSPDMKEQLQKIRDDYTRLRQGITNEKELTRLGNAEKRDIADIEALRDLLRWTWPQNKVEENYGRLVRISNHFNYLRSMGEVTLASLPEAVRPAMVHGLMPYLGTVSNLLTNLKAIKLSVAEAKLAGNVAERVLGTRLATLSEIVDPYSSRGPVEAFMENATNIASRWNGIRMLTDMQKSISAVMTQDRILKGVQGFEKIKQSERSYLAYLGIDQSMAERIAGQFSAHGETIDGVRVANTEKWTDAVARRTYRAAINKDVDSIITTKGVADVPLFANTATGRAVLQFKSFFLASHQRVLLRGLQESQARFIGGMLAMAGIGMFTTYMKAISGNREEKLADFTANPGWWVAEGLDKAGVLSIPMEVSNVFEKATGFNPLKAPIRYFDEGSRLSQRMQNRSLMGSIAGPTVGTIDDFSTVMGIPKRVIQGEEVTQGQKNAAERLVPFNSYLGMRQMLRHVINPPDGE